MLRFASALTATLVLSARAVAGDIDRDPINYSTRPESNPISRLQKKLTADQVKLPYDEKFGYLPAILKELRIPVSSQTLVFSKTSFQRHRIGPSTPRALYFNDEVYLGYCHLGNVLEVTAMDPNLGAVFYSLEQNAKKAPRFERHNDNCLICHASSQNQGMPGNLLRSVYADGEGQPVLSSGTFRIDHTSPIKHRWGGWYVTGKSGSQVHLGNLMTSDRRAPEEEDLRKNSNVTDLSGFFRTSRYLSGHSDIVALMVMEHQAEMHNRITRANFLTRQAIYDQEELDKALGRPNGSSPELTYRRIKSACDPLVKYLLMGGEAMLTDGIQGTTDYAKEFAAQGPRDARKRSLRDFDLEKRLFRYPCSYLIYSDLFEELPKDAKDYLYRRMWDVLHGRPGGGDFDHLTPEDCQAIVEILRATKANLPEYWISGKGEDR